MTIKRVETYVCDVCGEEKQPDETEKYGIFQLPSEWGFFTLFYGSSVGQGSIEFDVCPFCIAKAIPDEIVKKSVEEARANDEKYRLLEEDAIAIGLDD